MTSLKKSLLLACAASLVSFGVAFAQTDQGTPAPTGGTTAAPAAGDATTSSEATPKAAKKHMSKKHMKHSKKKKSAM